MHRILVIGSGGSGKSTLSAQIGERTGLPVIHLDALYWRAGWIPTSDADWRRTVTGLAAGDRWVMDGNYGGTLDLRLAACDTVVFLDVPRLTCIVRVVLRRLRNTGRTRTEMAAGCPERLTLSFIVWIWNYPRRRRPGIMRRLRGLTPEREIHVLHSRRDIDRFLAGLAHGAEV